MKIEAKHHEAHIDAAVMRLKIELDRLEHLHQACCDTDAQSAAFFELVTAKLSKLPNLERAVFGALVEPRSARMAMDDTPIVPIPDPLPDPQTPGV